MPGGPIRFQRPARILEPAAGTLSSGLPRVSQTQEKGRREMSSGPPGPKSIGIQTAQPRCFQPIRGRQKLWSLKSSTMPEMVGLLPGRHRGRSLGSWRVFL